MRRAAASQAPASQTPGSQAPAPGASRAGTSATEALALGVYVKLLRAARAIDARLEPAIAAAGLTPTQFGVLEALLHKGALTQTALGRKLLTSPGNMTDLLGKLERRGMIRRAHRPGDRRAVWVELTGPGRDRIATLFPAHAKAIAAAMAGLGAADLAHLAGLLRALGHGAAGSAPDAGQVSVSEADLAGGGSAIHLGDKSFDIE